MKLHPAYMEAARMISESPRDFFPYTEIAELLEVDLDSQDFQIQRMHLKNHALNEYDLDLIPTSNEHLGRGYKKATDEERVTITTPRLSRRITNAVKKQRKILTTVDPGLLNDKVRDLYNKNLVKNSMFIAFMEKLPLRKCIPGLKVSIKTPKFLLDKEIK